MTKPRTRRTTAEGTGPAETPAPAPGVLLAAPNVSIELLRPHPRNYRRHPADQLEHIRASLRQFGFYRPIVAARDYTILAGHGVTLAAREEGLREVPVVVLDLDPDSGPALKILAADNEIMRRAEVDDRALSEVLRDVKQWDSLLGTGFDDAMLSSLVLITRSEHEIPDVRAAANWSGLPGEGDLDGDPHLKVVVTVANEADRDEVLRRLSLTRVRYTLRNTTSVWFPEKANSYGGEFTEEEPPAEAAG